MGKFREIIELCGGRSSKGDRRLTIWTDDFIRSLVGDAGVLRDGQAIAKPAKWDSFARNDRAAWGLARGSAKDPYKTSLDLADGASKCSCPSRKFPCKHAVGLMFLVASGSVTTADPPPDWVATWIEGREKRQQPKPAPVPKPVDTAAQAKRQRAREAKVEAGLDELRRWLEDIMRTGLSDERIKSYSFWDKMAARMIDSQMSPVAGWLRHLGGKPFHRSSDWMRAMAESLGTLYALIDAYARLETLPEGLQADVRAALGFTLKTEEVTASGEAVRDLWRVMGSVTIEDDKLLIRRVWLYGERHNRYALLLDFTPKMRAFSTGYPLSSIMDAELIFYPSAYPQRALVRQIYATRDTPSNNAPFTTIEHMLNTYADALALNPFLERFPAGIAGAWLSTQRLEDSEQRWVEVRNSASASWLLAVTGGQPIPVFGEWDGLEFRPLTLLTDEGWLSISDGG